MNAQRTSLGIAAFSFQHRLAQERAGRPPQPLSDPLNYLEHCHRLGAGGIQTSLRVKDPARLTALRRKAGAYGMFVEGSTGLPRDAADVARFEADLRATQAAGGSVARIWIGGRRYEQFDSPAKFREFAARAQRSLELAAPVAERCRVRLAVENHKDFRCVEQLAVLKRLGSEYVGVCVDTGNNLALVEDPMETVAALAPFAFSAHLKDQAVRDHDAGFLLADVVLGDGCLNLAQMIETLRRARPEIRFSLEMATRDPLTVPCLTPKYWATLGDVPASDLARTLQFVRAHASDRMPKSDHLPLLDRVALEEENIRKCLAFAQQHLNI